MIEEENIEETAQTETEYIDFDSEQEPQLSAKQKRRLFYTASIAFLLAAIVFFPVDAFIRYILKESLAGSQVYFKSLDLNLFGNDTIESLDVAMPEGRNISAELIESGIGKLALLSNDLRGEFSIVSPAYSGSGLSLKARSLNATLDLSDALLPASNWDGSANIDLSSVVVEKLPPDIAIPLPLDDIQIRSVSLQTRWQRGTVTFNNSNVKSNVFQISITGSGRAVSQGNQSTFNLDAKVCLKPVGDLESSFPQIYGFYIFQGGAAGGQLCYFMRGPTDNLSFQKEETSENINNNPAP